MIWIQKEIENSRKKDNLIYQQHKIASIGELISTIAHQWRQPLAELTMSQNIILSEIEDNIISLDEISKSIKDEQKIVKFMSKTIDTFESFYTESSNVKEFYLYKAYENILFLIKETIELNSIDIKKSIDSSIKYRGDINALSQVLLAIIQNSIYFLQIRDINFPYIKIAIFRKNNKIFIIIEDNAKGIDESELKYIFDFNYSKRDDNKKSTGIGLYISKMIITDKFNGEILAKNTIDGVKFLIILRE